MHIKSIKTLENYKIEAVFFSGDKRVFDVKSLYEKHPEYRILSQDHKLWNSAKLLPYGSGVYFNDDLDLTAEEIWKNGTNAGKDKVDIKYQIANIIYFARLQQDISQSKLSSLTGIPQCDISRIEGGIANPTVDTLSKIFSVLNINVDLSSESA